MSSNPRIGGDMNWGVPDDIEYRIRGHLHEIEEINDEIIGSQQGLPVALKGYQKTLIHVAECAGPDEFDAVADYIKTHIRERVDRPANRKVRREARSVVSAAGEPPDPYLNRA